MSAPESWRVRYPDGRVVQLDSAEHAEGIAKAWGGEVIPPGEHHDPVRRWLTLAQRVDSTGTPGPWGLSRARDWFADGRTDGTEHVVHETRAPARTCRHVASGLTRNDAVWMVGAREVLPAALVALAAALDAADDLDGAAGEYVRQRVRHALGAALAMPDPTAAPEPTVTVEVTADGGPIVLSCSEHGLFAEMAAPHDTTDPDEHQRTEAAVRAAVDAHGAAAHPTPGAPP